MDWYSEPTRPPTLQVVFEVALLLGTIGLVFHGALFGDWSMHGLFFVLFFEVFVVLFLEVVRELAVKIRGKRLRKVPASFGAALLIFGVTAILAGAMFLILTDEGKREWSWPEVDMTMGLVMAFIGFFHLERLIKGIGTTGPLEVGIPWFLLVFLSLWFGGVATSQGPSGHYIPLFMIGFKALAQGVMIFRYWIAAGIQRLLFGNRNPKGQ